MKHNFIDIALKEAVKAYKKGEIPVGCVIIKDNIILAKAHNLIETKRNSTAHAEILAINKASKKIKNWRLNDCTLYTTLEPCKMCEGAIENSRISKVYYLTAKQENKVINTNCIKLNDKILEDENINLLQKTFNRKTK